MAGLATTKTSPAGGLQRAQLPAAKAYGGGAAAGAGGLAAPAAVTGPGAAYGSTGHPSTQAPTSYMPGTPQTDASGNPMVVSGGYGVGPQTQAGNLPLPPSYYGYNDDGTQPIGAPAPGAGGGGGGGAPGPGLDKNEIMDIINSLKPPPPPAREQAPGLLDREKAPGAIALPSAKSQGFARAKDISGRLGNQALAALRSQMVERGIEGSGVEGQLASNILGETARGVADASFAQERAAEQQAWDAAQLGFQGALTQRGQDLGLQSGNFSGNISQRGQDISAQPNMLALAPTILGLLGRRY